MVEALSRRGGWKREWVQGGLLAGLSMFVGLVIGEVVLALFWPQELGIWATTRDGMIVHAANMKQFSPTFGHDIVTNSAGMRDREHKIEKRANQFRIMVLGDSFMEAKQVNFEDAFSSVLERTLREITHRDIEVINAGVSGWGTDDELTYLIREGVKYKPDLVLVAMTLHNDISDNLMEKFHLFQNGGISERPIELTPAVSFLLLKVKEWLNAHSHLYRLLFRASVMQWAAKEGVALESHVGSLLRGAPPDSIKRGWTMTEQLLGKLTRVAHSIGAKVVVVLIPLQAQVSSDLMGPFLQANNLRSEEVNLLQPQETMAKITRRIGIPMIDLLSILKTEVASCQCEMHVHGDGHWNEKGHEIAGRFVAHQLAQL